MLIYSMGVSVDGFIADREGAFGWSAPSDELFRFHTALVSELGGCLLGRRLYETMLVWDTPLSFKQPAACRRGRRRVATTCATRSAARPLASSATRTRPERLRSHPAAGTSRT